MRKKTDIVFDIEYWIKQTERDLKYIYEKYGELDAKNLNSVRLEEKVSWCDKLYFAMHGHDMPLASEFMQLVAMVGVADWRFDCWYYEPVLNKKAS